MKRRVREQKRKKKGKVLEVNLYRNTERDAGVKKREREMEGNTFGCYDPPRMAS